MKPVIIIVFALAVVQGFLDVEHNRNQWHCRGALRLTFDKLGVNFQSALMLGGLGSNCIGGIKKAIDSVQSQIDKSPANGTECLKGLNNSLHNINATYEEQISTHLKTLVNNTIGQGFVKFSAELNTCVNNAPKCRDIVSCHDDFKKALFPDDSVTIGAVNRFINGLISDLWRDCRAVVNNVRDIRGNITLCS
ncbi:hypothetical protein RI129_009107 [Pyrocoelia pectoralis]|uniref:Uncharacterized protein n=1 Tax=Pyrocoelia pectoralis TaxID=417401 RepID=A0AAN7V6R9_9COLE